MNQQPQVIYVQKERNGCLWALAAVGLLAVVAFLWLLWGTVKFTQDVNQVPAIFDTAVQTLEATAPEVQVQTGVTILSTSTPFPTAVPQATATPYPTHTAVPLLTLSDHGLPAMGPYSLDQVEQCRSIIQSGGIDTLKSPQRELCEQYVGAGN